MRTHPIRSGTVFLALVFALALSGCAPGWYATGGMPALAVAMLSPIRDASLSGGDPYPIRYGHLPESGRAQLPASGPLWSLAPAAETTAACAEPPPHWLSPPPWQRGPGNGAATGGCARRL